MSYDQSEEDQLWQAAPWDSAAQAAGMSLANYEKSVIAHVFKAKGIVNGVASSSQRVAGGDWRAGESACAVQRTCRTSRSGWSRLS